jgi:hypothetical protein
VQSGQTVYPREQINNDFIAKALADSEGDGAGQDARAAEQKRPSGMMSLGGWW